MAKGENRLKILYILDILKKNSKKYSSDESGRFMSANQISKKLFDEHQLTSDRKSIYSYINSLEEYGCEFEKTKGGCYLLSCPNDLPQYSFETAELKVIADTLVLSRFYPASKTKKIIRKLEHLLPHGSVSLKGENVFIDNAIKSDNQAVIYNIDNIFHAINQDKQISFSYYNIEVEFGATGNHFMTKYRTTENGQKKLYIQSPFHLLWKNDTYYLLTFDSATQKERTFRVDRMRDVLVLNGSDNTADLKRDGKDYFSKIDVVEYVNTIFDMFGGEMKNVSLRVKKDLAKVIADEFGKKVSIYHDKYDEDFFLCSVNIQQSKTFFSWLSKFGNDVQITYPADVRQDYINYLKSILNGYETISNEQ